jgi:hypothetical protein
MRAGTAIIGLLGWNCKECSQRNIQYQIGAGWTIGSQNNPDTSIRV